MNVIREMQMNKIAFAALLLGAFTLSLSAKADPAKDELPPANSDDLPAATRDGMKLSEIRGIVSNFSVKIEGDQLVFSGGIPNECAKDRVHGEVESANGQHSLKIDFPKCRNGVSHLTAAQRADLRQLKMAIPAKSFDASVDGKFCLKFSVNGDGEAGCDPIMVGGKQLEHTSTTTLATRRAEEERKEKEAAERARLAEEASSRRQKEADFLRMATDLCRAGDFARLSDELEKQRDWFGDLTRVLSELGRAKAKSLEDALRKAKDPEALKAAYEALMADPSADSEKALETYVTRRSEMFQSAIGDRSKSIRDMQSVISQYEADMQDVEVENKKIKQGMAWAYTALGDRLRDDKDYSGAETQYEKALRYADVDGKVKIEQEMAKMFLAAAEECLKENKTKPAKCDALAKKARKHMDGAIAAQGRKRGDDAAEELAGMKMEKIQTFGVDGINVKVSGYGTFNPYGGSYDQQKRQVYQTGMQEEYMKRMMQMQMGLGFQGAGTGSGNSFFR